MSEVLASGLIIVSELAVAFAFGFGWVIYKGIKRRRNEHGQAKLFVEKLREKEPERNTQRINMLKESYGLDEEAINKFIEQLASREKSVYGKIIKLYLGAGQDSLVQLDEDIEALLVSCFISSENTNKKTSGKDDEVEIAVDPQQLAALTAENATLKGENEQLTTELEDLKAQSAEMISEYAMMYGKQGDKGREKVEEERDKVRQGDDGHGEESLSEENKTEAGASGSEEKAENVGGDDDEAVKENSEKSSEKNEEENKSQPDDKTNDESADEAPAEKKP